MRTVLSHLREVCGVFMYGAGSTKRDSSEKVIHFVRTRTLPERLAMDIKRYYNAHVEGSQVGPRSLSKPSAYPRSLPLPK
jgi:hypothetical protein